MLCPICSCQSGLRFNYVEFGTIKIWVHQPLPYSKELNCIAIAQPVGEEELTILSFQHICQADVVIFILLNNRYLRILNNDLCHIVLCISNFECKDITFPATTTNLSLRKG